MIDDEEEMIEFSHRLAAVVFCVVAVVAILFVALVAAVSIRH